MRITILRDGPYSDFQSDGKCGAVERRAGDVVNYPAWYARSLVESGLAREKVEIVTVTEPEVVPFEEPTVSQPVPWDEEADFDSSMTQVYITQAAARLVKEHGLDITQIKGTGKGGRITASDVRKVVPED